MLFVSSGTNPGIKVKDFHPLDYLCQKLDQGSHIEVSEAQLKYIPINHGGVIRAQDPATKKWAYVIPKEDWEAYWEGKK